MNTKDLNKRNQQRFKHQLYLVETVNPNEEVQRVAVCYLHVNSVSALHFSAHCSAEVAGY